MSVCPSVLLSACTSAASTGRIFVKFGNGDIYEKSVEKTPDLLKSDRNVGHFTWRLENITFILLAIVWNILQLDNIGKGTHCGVSLTTLNTFILLTTTCKSITIKKGMYCCVSTVQWLRERATKLLYTTLPFLMRNKIAVCVAVGENRGLRLECGVALHVDTFHWSDTSLTVNRGYV